MIIVNSCIFTIIQSILSINDLDYNYSEYYQYYYLVLLVHMYNSRTGLTERSHSQLPLDFHQMPIKTNTHKTTYRIKFIV